MGQDTLQRQSEPALLFGEFPNRMKKPIAASLALLSRTVRRRHRRWSFRRKAAYQWPSRRSDSEGRGRCGHRAARLGPAPGTGRQRASPIRVFDWHFEQKNLSLLSVDGFARRRVVLGKSRPQESCQVRTPFPGPSEIWLFALPPLFIAGCHKNGAVLQAEKATRSTPSLKLERV
jgi:hypothetical protein